MMVPANFYRLDVIDLVLRYERGFHADRRRSFQFSRYWRQRRGLSGCGKHQPAHDKAHRYLQKAPMFHQFSPFLE